jgi:hypothetical protein
MSHLQQVLCPDCVLVLMEQLPELATALLPNAAATSIRWFLTSCMVVHRITHVTYLSKHTAAAALELCHALLSAAPCCLLPPPRLTMCFTIATTSISKAAYTTGSASSQPMQTHRGPSCLLSISHSCGCCAISSTARLLSSLATRASSPTLLSAVTGCTNASRRNDSSCCTSCCIGNPVAYARPWRRCATCSVMKVSKPGMLVYSCQAAAAGSSGNSADRASQRSFTAKQQSSKTHQSESVGLRCGARKQSHSSAQLHSQHVPL